MDKRTVSGGGLFERGAFKLTTHNSLPHFAIVHIALRERLLDRPIRRTACHRKILFECIVYLLKSLWNIPEHKCCI